MVPLDLGAKGTCTIGGNAATNAGVARVRGGGCEKLNPEWGVEGTQFSDKYDVKFVDRRITLVV